MDPRAPLVSRWFVAAFTIVFAASVAAVLFASGIGGRFGFGPELAAGFSFTAYGALALGGFRRVPLEDRVSWWVAVMVAHVAFGLLAAWLFGVIGALGLGAALAHAFGGFAPALLVSLIAAPVAALPFRPSVPRWRVPRVRHATWTPSGEPEPDPRAVPAPSFTPARWDVPAHPPASPAPHPPADLAPVPGPDGPAGGAVLRITFARIADQLPPEMLALSPARLAATLLAPGEMLVPVELALTRFHEGAVDVPATVLDDQLPRGAVLASSPEARARWNALRLALPMDEVVAQLPADAPHPEISVVGVEVTEAVTGPSVGDVLSRGGSEPGDPPLHVQAVPLAPEGRPVEEVSREARTPLRRLRPDEIDTVLTCLAPAGRFATHSRDVDSLGHLLLVVRDVAPDAVETAVRGLVEVLPPAAGAPVVATLVTDRAAVAVAAGEGAAIATAAGHPEAPVALMELLVARAAAAIGLDPRGAPAERLVPVRQVSTPSALDLEALAAALESFGGVAPTVLRHDDDDGGLDVYVFSPSDAPPGPPGDFAAALAAALGAMGLGRLDAVSLRTDGFRTEVRWAEGRAAVLAASGPVTRPGIARRQAARAAALLEASGCR